jgi:hypothetical protein
MLHTIFMRVVPKNFNRFSRIFSVIMSVDPNVKMNRFLAEFLCSVADIAIH